MKNIILQDGVLFDLDIGWWSARKKLNAKDLKLKNVPDIFSLGAKYLVKKEHRKVFANIECKARRALRQWSFDFPLGGITFVHKNQVKKVNAELVKIKSDFLIERDKFLENYESYKNEILQKYPTLAKTYEGIYPPADGIREKFSFEWAVFRFSLPEEREYLEAAKKKIDDFVANVVKDLREQITYALSKLFSKKRDVVTKRSLERLAKTIDRLGQMNFVNDTCISHAIEELKTELDVPHKAINENASLKSVLKNKVKELLKEAADTSDIDKVTGTYKRKLMM